MTRRLSRNRALLAAAVSAVIPLAGCAAGEPSEPAGSTDGFVEDAPEDEGSPGVGVQGEGGAAEESLAGKVGEDVSFTGAVAKVLNPHAFTVGGDELAEEPILVVSADVPAGLAQGDKAVIEGTVEYFEVKVYEQDVGVDLVDNELTGFDGAPAVQASSVTIEQQG